MRRTDTRILACLVALALLPYLNAVGGRFAFDDEGMIVKNPVVQAPAWPVARLLTTTYEPGAIYRPLTFFTYWLNQRADPGRPAGFHIVNLLLHAATTVLVYGLSWRVLASRQAAAVSAALFAVHPVHTEAVTNIVGRAELLAALLAIAALLCVDRADRAAPHRARLLVLGAFSFIGALLSKESAFVVLPLAVIAGAASHQESLAAAFRRLCTNGALPLLAAIGAAYLGLRLAVIGTLALPATPDWLDNPLAHSGTAVRLATATTVLADYAGLLLAPIHLSADYSFDQVPLITRITDPRLLAAAALIGCVAVAVWRGRRGVPIAPGAALFCVAAISLTANILFPIGTVKAERLLYLPSVGLCVLAGALAHQAARRRPAPAALIVAAVLAAGAGRTWVRNADWASNLTLFRAAVASAPRSAKAHHNLGVALDAEARHQEAGLAFRAAFDLHPGYAEAAFGVGRMYEARGELDAALRWYTKTIRLNPRLPKALLNRGIIYYNHGDYAPAEADFAAGLAIEPDSARLLTGLGLSRLAQGDAREARRLIERAARLDTTDKQVQDALRLARNGAPAGTPAAENP